MFLAIFPVIEKLSLELEISWKNENEVEI